jgi:hypothetical protein
MYIFIITVFILPFLLAIAILKNRENIAIKNISLTENEEAHIDEEMIIHQALERAGALPSHHHQEKHLHKINRKKISIYNRNLLYTLGYLIIIVEIWYLYLLISKLI